MAAVGLAVAVAIAATGSGSSDAVAVFPLARTPVASPSTQVSFRGAPPSKLTGVSVVGSSTGKHAGKLEPHSDGNGASFVPDRRFRYGERVTVRADVPLVGERNGAVTFTIQRKSRFRVPKGGGDPGGNAGARRFRSQPSLRIPKVLVTKRSAATASGYLFTGPKAGDGPDGTLIVDERGQPVWFKRVPKGTSAFDFRVQQYEGKPVLTWWQGQVRHGQGLGDGLIYDDHYRPLARVRAGNGYKADFHEFQLTPEGSALMVDYNPVPGDLRPVGGPRHGTIMDVVVQEIDVKTGLVLFEWHSVGHVPLRESYDTRGAQPFDITHVNSVEEERNGNLLLSARDNHSLFEVDRQSGRIVWKLGGKRSAFKLSSGSQFISQHTTHRLDDDRITIFDNGAPPSPGREARGLVLKADFQKKTVRLLHSLRHPKHPHSPSQGSVQALSNGNYLVGWGGDNPMFTEFSSAGKLVFDAHYASTGDDTYRVYRQAWTGRPADRPRAAAVASGSGMNVYASWNGATEVARWQVLAGPSANALQPVATVARSGFETRAAVGSRQPFVAVRALDSGGKTLGESAAVAVK